MKTSKQPSKLLTGLFEHVDPERRLVVLDVGPASQESLDFFSGYCCRLHYIDLFGSLPLSRGEDDPPLDRQIAAAMPLPPDTRIDICLFWDLFNYLDGAAVAAFMDCLEPYLHAHTRGHAFAVHNLRAPRLNNRYAIVDREHIAVRERTTPLPGYAPHPQNELKSMLRCFEFQRSVLLTDSRLELLLSMRGTQGRPGERRPAPR